MEELRIDPSDGQPYGWGDWAAAYGTKAQEMWDRAGRLTVWHANKQTEKECLE
eukprot:COSAG01_NODE_70133_length_259_cov_0.968750_1_plen_52_part_10